MPSIFPRPDYRSAHDHADRFPVEPVFDGDEVSQYLHPCDECGGTQWIIVASFEDYEISTYSTAMECLNCGSNFKTPTPIDSPDYSEGI